MATIQEQTFATRLSTAMQPFDAGEAVGFGALCMDRESGIGGGSSLCPWEEVSSIWIPKTANALSVTAKGHGVVIVVRTRDVANVDVLFALAARRLGVALEPGGRFLSVEAD